MMLFRAGAEPWGIPTTAPARIGQWMVGPKRGRGVQDVDVLLLDAENRQALAAMRAYARAGLMVGAIACASEAWWAPSLRSRWCSLRATVPELSTDADGYARSEEHTSELQSHVN